MEKISPCYHCRFGYALVWPKGSAEKPLLCSACSLEYNKLKGKLEKHVPQDIQPQLLNQTVDGGSNLWTPKNLVPTSDTVTSSVISFDENASSLWKGPIPTKKRSPGDTGRIAEVGWFKNQLVNLHNCQTLYSDKETSEDDVLVYAPNKYIPENEIGLGCVLLNPDYTVKKLDHLPKVRKTAK